MSLTALGESGAFVGGRVVRRFPSGDGVLLVGDALLGLRDGFVRERERVFGGVERGAGGGDGSLVAPRAGVAR